MQETPYARLTLSNARVANSLMISWMQIAQIGCGSFHSKQGHVGVLGYLAAIYGLLSTAGADRQLYELGRKSLIALELELVDMTHDMQSGLGGLVHHHTVHGADISPSHLPRSGAPPGPSRQLELLEEGVRVFHEGRGSGRLLKVVPEDERGKPYRVQFDNGEVHSYSAASAAKLRVVTLSETLVPGARVFHDARGGGYIAKYNPDDARGKPYHVEFDSGEVHCYSESSVLKLRVIREQPTSSATAVDLASAGSMRASGGEEECTDDETQPPTIACSVHGVGRSLAKAGSDSSLESAPGQGLVDSKPASVPISGALNAKFVGSLFEV